MGRKPKRHSHEKPASRAHVVDVNMGYGHSRPAHALRDLSGGRIISANDYRGIPQRDFRLWKQSRQLYEAVSRLKPIPFVGDAAFGIMDSLQRIAEFYPRRDLSRPGLQTRQIYGLIRRGLGKHLIETLREHPLPIVSTFFIPAFIADHHDYPGEIYCVTTDADISRAWAPLDPKNSRIKYFASNGRVVERLKLYGVRSENIFLTGFPLPKELIGGPDSSVLKDLLAHRLCNLDPKGLFHERYEKLLRATLGTKRCIAHPSRPVTVTYVVGGAGAQRHLGVEIMRSLAGKIRQGRLRLNLVAGPRPDVVAYFKTEAVRLGLKGSLGEWINIPIFADRRAYFDAFPGILKETDIIWTKPSEMSFYTGLGFAVITSEPIGSQEEFNRVWLDYVGGGVPQLSPAHADEWLFDWIDSGGVARMAWNGFVEAPTHGVYRIEDIVSGRESELPAPPLIV